MNTSDAFKVRVLSLMFSVRHECEISDRKFALLLSRRDRRAPSDTVKSASVVPQGKCPDSGGDGIQGGHASPVYRILSI